MPAKHYGPNGCVALTKSSTATCVLKTNCRGMDLHAFEFAFDCVSASDDVVRHSYGLGGFDEAEEFDSGVQCDRCETGAEAIFAARGRQQKDHQRGAPPAPVPRAAAIADQVAARPTQKLPTLLAPLALAGNSVAAKVSTVHAKAVAGAAAHGPVSKYGPDACVSTWRAPKGNCMMETKCRQTDIDAYEFGLVCVDSKGVLARHVFGQDSFDPEEMFDTQIECAQCLALNEVPTQSLVAQPTDKAATIATLSAEVTELSQYMRMVQGMIVSLKTEVARRQELPAIAAATAATAVATTVAPLASTQAFLARGSNVVDGGDQSMHPAEDDNDSTGESNAEEQAETGSPDVNSDDVSDEDVDSSQ